MKILALTKALHKAGEEIVAATGMNSAFDCGREECGALVN
jgi:hypothetical protein